MNLHILIRIATAAVWFVFGFIFKVLHLVPRHHLIVASILGEEVAGPVTLLIGYRVFARYRSPDGRELRGLRILRSDTNNKLMAVFGSLLTHYYYGSARVETIRRASALQLQVTTPDGNGVFANPLIRQRRVFAHSLSLSPQYQWRFRLSRLTWSGPKCLPETPSEIVPSKRFHDGGDRSRDRCNH